MGTWLIASDMEAEKRICEKHGWPSVAARDALFLFYYRKYRGNLFLRYRWVLRHPRLELDDLIQEAMAWALHHSLRWEPEKGPFAFILSRYGQVGADHYIAKFAATISRSRQSRSLGRGKVKMSLFTEDIEWAYEMPPVDPILRRNLEKVKLSPAMQELCRSFAEGETDLGEYARQRGCSRNASYLHKKTIRERILELFPSLQEEVFGQQ